MIFRYKIQVPKDLAEEVLSRNLVDKILKTLTPTTNTSISYSCIQ